MEAFFLDEIAGERKIGRRRLPFRFSGQARTGPARVSIGFEITHVADRLGRIYFAQTGESEAEPLAIALLPIQRRSPLLVIDRGPAKRQPELGAFVTAIFHELQIFAIRDESRREFKLFQKYAMPRSFVVKSKIISLMANGISPFLKNAPAQWGERRQFLFRGMRIHGTKRILREHMLDVGQK